ncbi:MAG: PKD domain-containing protein [Ruminiclostridium sp.]|nr:PKD domain-containing protein [Ruminiclostridium sp.]
MVKIQNKRRIIIFLLVTLLMFSAIPTYASTTLSSWAVPEVEKAKEYGLVTQTVLGNYQRSITREEFCELAVKLYEALSGKTSLLPSFNRFTDTNNPEILKANALGIVNGVNAEQTLFAPYDNVNREQIAVMFYRTLAAVDLSLIPGRYPLTFSDKNQVSDWALDAVGFMSKNGIIGGVGGNRMDPKGPATREQGIALVKRTFEKFRGMGVYTPPVHKVPVVIQASNPQAGYQIYQKITPETGTAKVVSGDLSVTIPFVNLTESKILSVKKAHDLKPASNLNFVQAFDIQLGNQTQFTSPVEIAISVPEDKPYGAFYYNPAAGEWEDIPYEQKNRTITIKTHHLSRYGVAETENSDYYDPMAEVFYYYPDFRNIGGLNVNAINQFSAAELDRQALKKGWTAATMWFNIGSIGTGFLDNSLPGFEKLNTAMGNMGKVITPIQIYFDIRDGKHTSAAANAYEMAIGTLISKFGESGANIGMLGASLINLSIREFAEAAISSKESQYEKAYAYYYNKNNSLNRTIDIRDGKGWYDAFYQIVSASPKNLNERINADIRQYVRAIWDDPELLTAQGIIGQQGESSTITGGGAYLNDELKERLSENYAQHLSGYLETILNEVVGDYEWSERQRFKKEYGDKVVAELNKTYTLSVTVNSSMGNKAGLSVGAEAGGQWNGTTDSSGRWTMNFTLLGYIRAGTPRQVYFIDENGRKHTAAFDLNNLSVVFGNEGLQEFTITSDRDKILSGEEVAFTAVVRPDNLPYTLKWIFGDGSEQSVPLSNSSTRHQYIDAGTYNISAHLFDANQTVIDSKELQVIVTKKSTPQPTPDGIDLDMYDFDGCEHTFDYSKLTKHIITEKIIDGYVDTIIYYDVNGIAQGLSVSCYRDDNTKRAKKVCYYDGKKQGKEVTWYINGELALEANYVDGILHGVNTHYYKSGVISKKRTYVNGDLLLDEEFYSNGQKHYEFSYALNPAYSEGSGATRKMVEHGVHRRWYEDGQIMVEIPINYGLPHGLKRWWYPDGQVSSEEYYENGEKIWFKIYNSAGGVINEG